MKRIIFITLSLLVILCSSSWAFEIFQVGAGPYDYRAPAVYEDTVVFMYGGEPYADYYREGNNIWAYDLKTHTEFKISSQPVHQWFPDIYGDTVVWYDDRTGDNEVYGYDLFSKTEFQITDNPYDQINAFIYGKYVVWQDNRNGNYDIYGYDLDEKREFEVVVAGGNQYAPSIDGQYVVWEDDRNGEWRWGSYDVFACYINPDGSVSEEFNIVDSEHQQAQQKKPNVFNNIAAWADYRNGSWDIYAKNLATQEDEFPIVIAPNVQYDVQLSENYAIWMDNRNEIGQHDVYGYDLLTGEEFPITTYPTSQWRSDIWGNVVVWEEHPVGGSWGIYGAIIPEPSTIFLLTAGLFGVFNLKRKK